MSEKLKRVDGGLSALKKSLDKVQLEIPKLDPAMMQDPTRFHEVVKAKMAGVKQIREGMSNALSWLDQIQEWIDQIEDDEERRIAQETAASDVTKMEDYIQQCLSLEEGAFKRTAGVIYLLHVFARDLQSCEEANELLADLGSQGFLEKDAEGSVTIGYSQYRVSSNYGFGEKEVREIEEAVGNFSRKLKQLIHQGRVEKAKEFEKQTENTLQELLDGKAGKCLLADIPPENFINRDGEENWRPGGSLFVEFDGKQYIRPLGAVGAIQRSVDQAIELGVSLEHRTLTWEGPPGLGRSFQRIVDGVMRSRGLSKERAEEYVRKTQFFWHLIRRATEASKDREKLEVLKEEYSQEADITPEELYGLNCESKEGTASLEFDGVFKNKNSEPPVHNLFGLFRQEREENGEFAIEFLKGPEHVEKFLAQCKGKKYPTGKNFKDAPEPLGRILRAIRGQVDMAVQIDMAVQTKE